jgi:hypothetical protein
MRLGPYHRCRTTNNLHHTAGSQGIAADFAAQVQAGFDGSEVKEMKETAEELVER